MPQSPSKSTPATTDPVVITWTGETRVVLVGSTDLVLAAGDTAIVPAAVAESLTAQGYVVLGETTTAPQEG